VDVVGEQDLKVHFGSEALGCVAGHDGCQTNCEFVPCWVKVLSQDLQPKFADGDLHTRGGPLEVKTDDLDLSILELGYPSIIARWYLGDEAGHATQ
jgi:hypothetical protein